MIEAMLGSPRVAVWGTFDVANYGDLLFPRVFEHELRRRLPDADIRSFAPLGHLHPVPLDGGFMAEPLVPWNDARAEDLAEQLDLIAIGGGEIIHTHDEYYELWYGGSGEGVRPSELFIEALGPERETRCPVVWHAVGIPFDLAPPEAERVRTALKRRPYVTVRDNVSLARLRAAGLEADIKVVPDSALLVDRLFPRDVLARRLRFLRATDAYPDQARPLVIQGSAALIPVVDSLAAVVRAALRDHPSAPVVLLETGPCHNDGAFADALAARLPTRVHRVGKGATVEDIVAAIAHARAVACVSLHAAITAFVYGIPHAILNVVGVSKLEGFASLAGHGGLYVTTTDHAEDALRRVLAGATPQTRVSELAAQVDSHFDRIAELAVASAGARSGDDAAASPANALARLQDRYDVLRAAHAARGARLVEDGERRQADLEALSRVKREREELRGELARLQAMKTFRYTRLVRYAYARLRTSL
jgi:polysaccharide pyruvyl transferase WcaK-like protein